MLRVTGAGTVHFGKARTQLGRKPIFVWWMSRWRDVQELVRQSGQYSMKLQKVTV